MKYEIQPNGNLRLFLIEGEKEELIEYKNECEESRRGFGSDDALYDWFDRFIRNDSFEWIDPSQVDALTSAPMLGLFGPGFVVPFDQEIEVPHQCTGGSREGRHIEVIEAHWAFMDYQISSVLQRLLDSGEAVFQKGHIRSLDARQYAKTHWSYNGDGPDPDDGYETYDRWFGGHWCPQFKQNKGFHYDRKCRYYF